MATKEHESVHDRATYTLGLVASMLEAGMYPDMITPQDIGASLQVVADFYSVDENTFILRFMEGFKDKPETVYPRMRAAQILHLVVYAIQAGDCPTSVRLYEIGQALRRTLINCSHRDIERHWGDILIGFKHGFAS